MKTRIEMCMNIRAIVFTFLKLFFWISVFAVLYGVICRSVPVFTRVFCWKGVSSKQGAVIPKANVSDNRNQQKKTNLNFANFA